MRASRPAGVTANTSTPSSNVLPAAATRGVYARPAALATMLPQTIANVGGSQPHENRQPYLVLNYVIALQGVFPSQT